MSPVEQAVARMHRHIVPDGSCWIWQAAATAGVPRSWLFGKPIPTARALWLCLKGPIPPRHRVRRTCATPRCVHPDHQRLEFMVPPSVPRVLRRLSPEAVRSIRDAYASGRRVCVLAREFNADPGHVGRIVRRQRWRNVL